MALQTPKEFADYLNSKEGFHRAYTNGDGKNVILPYFYQFKLDLPALEADGETVSNQNFRFLNKFRLPVKVSYSGQEKA